jgi:hypothetical protein
MCHISQREHLPVASAVAIGPSSLRFTAIQPSSNPPSFFHAVAITFEQTSSYDAVFDR